MELIQGAVGLYTSFINGEKEKDFLVVFDRYDDDGSLRFQISTSHNEWLVISPKCFPVFEWQSGDESSPIKRKTIIEMHPR